MSFAPRTGLYVEARRGGPPLVASDHAPITPPRSAQPPASRGELVVRAPIDADALAALCERLRRLLERGADLVMADVDGDSKDSIGTVGALARLQLTAQRLGGSIRLRNASAELHDMLSLAGLCEIVGPCAPLPLEARGQAEEREEPLGVEEERDAADPIA